MFILSVIILSYIVLKTNFRIELSVNIIGTRSILFYPISLIGIYFCLYLAKIIARIKYLNKYFDIIGNYSFEIMALHFFIIKIIDIVYASINGISSYNAFPYAFSGLWPIYIILGCTIPAYTFYLIDNIFKMKKNRKITNICTHLFKYNK